jgi:hypothetical protein
MNYTQAKAQSVQHGNRQKIFICSPFIFVLINVELSVMILWINAAYASRKCSELLSVV